MSDGFTATCCGGVSAVGVWTLGWLTAAYTPVRRVVAFPDGWAVLGAGVALLMTALGCWLTGRLLRNGRAIQRGGRVARSERGTFREPWPRRIFGFCAVIFFVCFAVMWNIGFISWPIQLADEGEGGLMLVLIPWSVIGLFLLIMLFAVIGVTIGWLWRIW